MKSEDKPKGYRNALTVLNRFELISIVEDNYIINLEKLEKYSGYEEAIWISASSEATMLEALRIVSRNPNITGVELGSYIADKFSMEWTQSSMLRNGSSIKKWVTWINDVKNKAYSKNIKGVN